MDRNEQGEKSEEQNTWDNSANGNENENKIAQNPNTRANENTKTAFFEKDKDAEGVGSEITDGEGG